MVFQALIAGECADARLAVALTRLDVASRGRQWAHQVALAVPAAGLDVSISILWKFQKNFKFNLEEFNFLILVRLISYPAAIAMFADETIPALALARLQVALVAGRALVVATALCSIHYENF